MVDTLQRYTKEDEIRAFKAIAYEPLSKIKKVMEHKDVGPEQTDYKFKLYPLIRTPWGIYDYLTNFLFRVRLTYNTYLLVKDAKTFDELVKKASKLSMYDVMKFGRRDLKYFDFSLKLEEDYFGYFSFYIVAKWLKLKPNKEFKEKFEKIKELLEDKKMVVKKNRQPLMVDTLQKKIIINYQLMPTNTIKRKIKKGDELIMTPHSKTYPIRKEKNIKQKTSEDIEREEENKRVNKLISKLTFEELKIRKEFIDFVCACLFYEDNFCEEKGSHSAGIGPDDLRIIAEKLKKKHSENIIKKVLTKREYNDVMKYINMYITKR